MGARIQNCQELTTYQNAMKAAMEIFNLSKAFPPEEKYSLVDQVRRSSRSVCANLAEAWRKRQYEAAFVAKISDAESEANETQVWLEFSDRCGYLKPEVAKDLQKKYDHIIAQLVRMRSEPTKWRIK